MHSIRNTAERYGLMARSFHWSMALIILGLLAVGIYMEDLAREDANRGMLYGLHKSFGALALALVAVRLSWRLMDRPPALPPTLPSWQAVLARSAHVFLYVAMVVMPLSGWVMSEGYGHSVSVFGWFELPQLVTKNIDLAKLAQATHFWMSRVMIAVLVMHIGGALMHRFHYKDDIFRRMA